MSANGENLAETDQQTPLFDLLPLREWPAQVHPDVDVSTLDETADASFREIVLADYPEEAANLTPPQYRIGNTTLPIARNRVHTANTVWENQVTVLESPTGSGKTTQIGPFMLERGAIAVFITQPTRLATDEIERRVSDEFGPHANLVGRETGNTAENNRTPENIHVTQTAGTNLEKINEIIKLSEKGVVVVVIDEAHIEDLSTELIMGMYKDVLPYHPNIHLVVSSATIDAKKRADYFADPAHGRGPAPIISLTGAPHKIEERFTTDDVATTMAKMARETGKNGLAFLPGKPHIAATIHSVRTKAPAGYKLIPLHGELSTRQQREAFEPTEKLIFSTKISETSVTVPDLYFVTDGGYERIGTYENDVSGLSEGIASQATRKQRMGRVGRTGDGIFIDAQLPDHPPVPPVEERPAFSVPEIQRTDLTSAISRLLSKGHRLEDLDLLNSAPEASITFAYQRLLRLGAVVIRPEVEASSAIITWHDYQQTEINKAMASLGLASPLARLLVEARIISQELEAASGMSNAELLAARQQGERLRLLAAAGVAVQQNGTMLSFEERGLKKWQKEQLSSETTSDFRFEMDVFVAMLLKEQVINATYTGSNPEDEFDSLLEGRYGLIAQRYRQAKKTFLELCHREKIDPNLITPATKTDRQALIRCQVVSADEVFTGSSNRRTYTDKRGERRELGQRSNVDHNAASLLVGRPFNLSTIRGNGFASYRFINGATRVTPEELQEYAPRRVTYRTLGHIALENGGTMARRGIYFDGQEVGERLDEPEANEALREFIVRALMTGTVQISRKGRADEVVEVPFKLPPQSAAAVSALNEGLALQHKTHRNLGVREWSEKRIRHALQTLQAKLPLEVTDIATIDAHLPRVYPLALVRPTVKKTIRSIQANSPDFIEIGGQQIPVKYHEGKARLVIPRSVRHSITPDNVTTVFQSLGEDRLIEVRVDDRQRGHYYSLEKLLARNAELQQTRRERRTPPEVLAAQKRAELQTIPESQPNHTPPLPGKTRRSKTPIKTVPKGREMPAKGKRNKQATA